MGVRILPGVLGKIKETRLKKKEKQIRDEQKLLKTLIDNLPLNVYIKDSESRKVLVNKSEIIYCGFKEEAEVLGKNDFDFYDENISKGDVQSSRVKKLGPQGEHQ